jgi:S1-C subfamily serine protease
MYKPKHPFFLTGYLNRKAKYFHIFLFLFLIQSSLLSQKIGTIPSEAIFQLRVFSQETDPYTPWSGGGVHRSSGTGFILKGKKMITNAHVVARAKYIMASKGTSNQWFPVRVRFFAHDCDLAFLEPLEEDFWTGSSSLEMGGIPESNTEITVVGYPMGGSQISYTRGIVSRVEQQTYSHSLIDAHLTIQVDAAINPGNSGGPVIQDNKVVGVAFQAAVKAENIGYAIPTNVLKHFLKDIEDGSYDGYVELGIKTQNTMNPTLREYLKLPDNVGGVLITDILEGASADGVLKKGDVLIEVEGHPISKDGLIQKDGRALEFIEIFDFKFKDEPTEFSIIRDGKIMQVILLAKKWNQLEWMRSQYGESYPYVIHAGLVFQELSRDLIQSLHRHNHSEVYSQLEYYFQHGLDDHKLKDDERFIVFYRKLNHRINNHAEPFLFHILDKVNQTEIRNLNTLKQILKESRNDFDEFQFIDLKSKLVIERDKAFAAQEQIQILYNLYE